MFFSQKKMSNWTFYDIVLVFSSPLDAKSAPGVVFLFKNSSWKVHSGYNNYEALNEFTLTETGHLWKTQMQLSTES